MAYDLHGAYDGATGQNAPLLASSKDNTPEEQKLNIKYIIQSWIKAGAAPSKLVLGLGMFGKSFTLTNPANNGIKDNATAGAPGAYTGEAGFLGYNEICENIKLNGWTEVWDDEQKVPYAYKGNQWVGYDNAKSIALKVDLIKSKSLGGAMVWTVDTDDFKGKCGTKYPLLNTVYSKIFSKSLLDIILGLLG